MAHRAKLDAGRRMSLARGDCSFVASPYYKFGFVGTGFFPSAVWFHRRIRPRQILQNLTPLSTKGRVGLLEQR
jgi:hypothetical protein